MPFLSEPEERDTSMTVAIGFVVGVALIYFALIVGRWWGHLEYQPDCRDTVVLDCKELQ